MHTWWWRRGSPTAAGGWRGIPPSRGQGKGRCFSEVHPAGAKDRGLFRAAREAIQGANEQGAPGLAEGASSPLGPVDGRGRGARRPHRHSVLIVQSDEGSVSGWFQQQGDAGKAGRRERVEARRRQHGGEHPQGTPMLWSMAPYDHVPYHI